MQPNLIRLRYIYIIFLLFLIQTLTCTGLWVSKAWAASLIKVGLLEEPRTLNIWLASDTWSLRVLGQIYQPLYIREPNNLKLVPWLAKKEPVYDAATLSYTVKLRAAKWSDGTELTSEDVAFTGNLIKEFKIPRHYSKWKFIKKIEVLDKKTVKFSYSSPRPSFCPGHSPRPLFKKKSG